jgi:hypothetical protein
VRTFELKTGKTRWHTWDLHLCSNGNTEVRALFLRSDEVDRVVVDHECAILTLMSRNKHLSSACMGRRIIEYVRNELPRTCTLVEWHEPDEAGAC